MGKITETKAYFNILSIFLVAISLFPYEFIFNEKNSQFSFYSYHQFIRNLTFKPKSNFTIEQTQFQEDGGYVIYDSPAKFLVDQSAYFSFNGAPHKVEFPPYSLIHQKVTLYILRDAYVLQREKVISNYSITFNHCYRGFKGTVYSTIGTNFAIATQSIFYTFGHWITDVFAILTCIPEWVWSYNPALLVHKNPPKSVVEMLYAIIGREITILSSKDFIFSRTLFIVQPYEDRNMLSPALIKPMLWKYYRLMEKKVNSYGYTNRESRQSRYIKNMDEIIEEFQKISKVKFRRLKINIPTVSDYLREINNLLIYITPGGSGAFNMIFMQPYSGVLIFGSSRMDYPNCKIAMESGLFCIYQVNHEISHFGRGGNNINVSHTIECYKTLIDAVKNKKFNFTNHIKPAFNFRAIKDLKNRRHPECALVRASRLNILGDYNSDNNRGARKRKRRVRRR